MEGSPWTLHTQVKRGSECTYDVGTQGTDNPTDIAGLQHSMETAAAKDKRPVG